MNVIVYHGSEQVVCGADGMKISGEMKINVLHRHHLGITAACCAAFNAEYRAERRLTKCDGYTLADSFQSVRKTDGGCRFSLAGRRGRNCSDKNQFPIRAFGFVHQGEVNLRFVPAVLLDVFFRNPCFGGYFRNRFH